MLWRTEESDKEDLQLDTKLVNLWTGNGSLYKGNSGKEGLFYWSDSYYNSLGNMIGVLNS